MRQGQRGRSASSGDVSKKKKKKKKAQSGRFESYLLPTEPRIAVRKETGHAVNDRHVALVRRAEEGLEVVVVCRVSAIPIGVRSTHSTTPPQRDPRRARRQAGWQTARGSRARLRAGPLSWHVSEVPIYAAHHVRFTFARQSASASSAIASPISAGASLRASTAESEARLAARDRAAS